MTELQAKYGSSLIFVFGSNLAGRHGKGAAQWARQHYKACSGKGYGPCGRSYAIPTKDHKLQTLPLDQIQTWVNEFKRYASINPHLLFYVTRVGCGLAGYTDSDIEPLFQGSPSNCIFTWGSDYIDKVI